jgi:hypothetical protein
MRVFNFSPLQYPDKLKNKVCERPQSWIGTIYTLLFYKEKSNPLKIYCIATKNVDIAKIIGRM